MCSVTCPIERLTGTGKMRHGKVTSTNVPWRKGKERCAVTCSFKGVMDTCKISLGRRRECVLMHIKVLDP